MSGAKSFAGASAAVPASTPLLDIQDVSKGFTLHAAGRRVRGCEHISMRVGHGEFVGVTGRLGFGQIDHSQVHLPHQSARVWQDPV